VKIRILAIGKPKLRYAADGIAEFQKRLQRACKVEIEYLKDKDESRQLLERSAGTYRIAMDERGDLLTTDKFVDRINALEQRGDVKTVSFLIGGSDGHSEELRQNSDALLALSPLTLQHELALVVLLEQIYRAYSIKRGEPYHRP
jgi:23S rRNA (pseudouridine1915-N3)-methyltransferase